MSFLRRLQVFDNSAPAEADGNILDPVLVLEMVDSNTLVPDASDLAALASTPAWARPLAEEQRMLSTVCSVQGSRTRWVHMRLMDLGHGNVMAAVCHTEPHPLQM